MTWTKKKAHWWGQVKRLQTSLQYRNCSFRCQGPSLFCSFCSRTVSIAREQTLSLISVVSRRKEVRTVSLPPSPPHEMTFMKLGDDIQDVPLSFCFWALLGSNEALQTLQGASNRRTRSLAWRFRGFSVRSEVPERGKRQDKRRKRLSLIGVDDLDRNSAI